MSVNNLASEMFVPAAVPHHHCHTRLADKLRTAAMDRIPSETKAIYDLLRADFDQANRDRVESTAKALAQLDAKLDLLSGRIDEVKVSIGVNLDGLRQGLDKSTPQALELPRSAPVTPPRAPSGGSTGPDGLRFDNENREQGHKVYVPPPVRGMHFDQAIQRVPFAPLENSRQTSADVFGVGPRIEMPRFDGANPKLWQTRCEDYFRFWGTPHN